MFISSPLLRQYAVVLCVNLCVISVGFGLVWPSPVLVKLRNETETVLPEPIDEANGSWLVSISFFISIFANFLPAMLVDRIGRKYCIMLGCVPKILVCLILTFASQLWMLLLGRALGGIADSFIFNVVPMYASEMASKEVRGALGTILQIFCSLGIVAMFSIGPFISYIPLNIIYTCSTIITTIPILFLPDTPYFLYSKGRTSESMKVLTYLRGSEVLASEEIKEYALSNKDECVNKKDLFTNRIFLKALAIAVIIGIGTQLIGFNAVSFYLQTVLESTHTSIRPEIASVIIGMVQLFASFCTASVTDKFGRKPILASSLVGTGVGMLGMGTFFKLQETGQPITGVMNYVPLVSIVLIVFSYSAGPGSLYWMLMAELFDGPARGTGMCSSLTIGTAFGFLTLKYFPMMTAAIGAAAMYWVFSVNCVLWCLFVVFCLPETKGKTFAEIQVCLGAKISSNDEKQKPEKC